MAGTTTTNDFWFTAVLNYLGYQLVSITKTRGEQYDFVVACPELDFADLYRDYQSGQGLAVGNVKALLKAWNEIVQLQKQMRRDGEDVWTSDAWIRGEVG
jgi:hypothetical protein